ncbi:restriction endonuclease subunit S [Psychrosphaera aquimarina]|uniref:Restriction endonuclease subunit S n=1 Tax=Psychrosphaera aquimarina TaxID=2044854 RepID=A0ABU3QYD1_9GAMM|nr:restriction endonuclease subunit S [Psychrosphaera aquimarina]MDU0112289.1 restriction endonuclease subunit S [Psychrosphaera aquimarina]
MGYVGNVNDHYCSPEEGVPFYRTLNIRNGHFRHVQLKYVTHAFNEKNKKSQIKNNDILIARVGANLGMVCKADGLHGLANMANSIIIKTDLVNDADADFFTYFLLSPMGKNQIFSGAAGGAQGVFNTKLTQEIKVPIPPYPEQQKIATILGTWDKAISTTEHLIENSKQQKKALMQQLLTGTHTQRKRLLDDSGKPFDGDWIFSIFTEIFKVANDKKTQVKSGDYLEIGEIPVVDQGKQLISGYTNNAEKHTNLPVIIFGDHTRIIKWVDFEFAQGADGTQVLKENKCLDAKFSYYLLQNTDIPNLGYSRHMRELKEKDFKYPKDKQEQQKIASVLTNADNEIELLKQQLTDLKQEKKALMQQLLTGKRRVIV